MEAEYVHMFHIWNYWPDFNEIRYTRRFSEIYHNSVAQPVKVVNYRYIDKWKSPTENYGLSIYTYLH
jgi:hypothetical protein